MDKHELVAKTYALLNKVNVLEEALQEIVEYCDVMRVHPDDDPIPTDKPGQIARDALLKARQGKE